MDSHESSQNQSDKAEDPVVESVEAEDEPIFESSPVYDMLAKKKGNIANGVMLWKSAAQRVRIASGTPWIINHKVRTYPWAKSTKLAVLDKKKKYKIFKKWEKKRLEKTPDRRLVIGKIYYNDLLKIPNDLNKKENFSEVKIFDEKFEGVTYEDMTRVKNKSDVARNLKMSVESLTKAHPDVNFIMAEHGCFISYQDIMSRHCSEICMASPMVILPLLLEGLHFGGKVLNVVNSSNVQTWDSYTTDYCMVGRQRENVVNFGIDAIDHDGFKENSLANPEEKAKMRSRLVDALEKEKPHFFCGADRLNMIQQQKQFAETDGQEGFCGIGAVILNCGKLPSFAPMIKECLKAPVYDHLSIIEGFQHAYRGYSRDHVKNWRMAEGLENIKNLVPGKAAGNRIGIIGISSEEATEPVVGIKDVDGVEFAEIRFPGITYKTFLNKKELTTKRRKMLLNAVQILQENECSIIIGATGLLESHVNKLKTLESPVTGIVFPSALALLPMALSMTSSNSYVLVLTSEEKMMKNRWSQVLSGLPLSKRNYKRLILRGFKRWNVSPETMKHFTWVDYELKVVQIVMDVLRKYEGDNIPIIVVESFNMLPFSNTLRNLFGKCVLDHMSLVDLIASGFSDNKALAWNDQPYESPIAENPPLKFSDMEPVGNFDLNESLVKAHVIDKRTQTVESALFKQARDHYEKIRKTKLEMKSKLAGDQNALSKSTSRDDVRKICAYKWNQGTKNKIKKTQEHLNQYASLVADIKRKQYKPNYRPLWDEPEFGRYYGTKPDARESRLTGWTESVKSKDSEKAVQQNVSFQD